MRMCNYPVKAAISDVMAIDSEAPAAIDSNIWPCCDDSVKCTPWHPVSSGDRINVHHRTLAEICAAWEVGRSSS